MPQVQGGVPLPSWPKLDWCAVVFFADKGVLLC
jgi:hypothetical protein